MGTGGPIWLYLGYAAGISAAVVGLTFLVAGCVRLFQFLIKRQEAIMAAVTGKPLAERHLSYQWKIVKLDGPIQKNLGIPDVAYGVIISTDAMLSETRSLLFCPLIDGMYHGAEAGTDPWHVVVTEVDRRGGHGQLPSSRMLLSTKIVLPISPDEVNGNRLEYGYLTYEQQRQAAARFKAYLPDFHRNPAVSPPRVNPPSAAI